MEVLILLLQTEEDERIAGYGSGQECSQQMMMREILQKPGEGVYFVYTTTMNLFDKLKESFNCSR